MTGSKQRPGQIAMVTVYEVHLSAHVYPLGSWCKVRDDYRAAERPVISQLNGNWAFPMQSQGCQCPQPSGPPVLLAPSCVSSLGSLGLILHTARGVPVVSNTVGVHEDAIFCLVPSLRRHEAPELSPPLSSTPEFGQHSGHTKMAPMALRPKLINHHFILAISSAAIGIFISNQLLQIASFKGA